MADANPEWNEPLRSVKLSDRARKALMRCGVSSLGEAARLLPVDLLSVKNCGPGTVREIEWALAEKGLRLGMDLSAEPGPERRATVSSSNGQGYVRNCVLVLRPGENETPICSEDGPVVASLTDYAIIPLGLYQELAKAASHEMPNVISSALRGMILNIEPQGAEEVCKSN